MSRTMHNPAFAQRTWARLRALRPLDHMHPADRERMQRAAEGEKLVTGGIKPWRGAGEAIP